MPRMRPNALVISCGAPGAAAKYPRRKDAAWSQLGPGEQAQGRASYDRFWRSIESVEVSDVERVGGPGTDTQTVEATLTYRTTAGRVSTERHRLQLVRSDDGGYRIDARRELPPVTFTPGEASALVASLVSVGPYISASAQAALAKLLEAP